MLASRAERRAPGPAPAGAAPGRSAVATLAAAVGLALTAAGCGGEAADAGAPAAAEAVGSAAGEEARSPEEALADSIVGAWIRAAGGAGAWDSVRTARYTVTTVWHDSTGAVRRMRPRRVELRKTPEGEQARIERPEAEGLYVQAWTGDTAWATLNGRPLPPDHPAAREAEYVGRDVVYWFGLPHKLEDSGVVRRARALPDGGYEVRVTFGDEVGAHPGDRYFYYFTDQDPYPEEVHYIEQGRTEEDRNRSAWSGFREAPPLTYVVDRRYRDAAGRPTKTLRIDDVHIGPDLPDSLFRPPEAGSGGSPPATP